MSTTRTIPLLLVLSIITSVTGQALPSAPRIAEVSLRRAARKTIMPEYPPDSIKRRSKRAERDRKDVLPQDEAKRNQIDAQELQRFIKTGQKVVILDVRDRQTYAAGHAPGSKNIPSDELDVRAINELSPTDFIVTSCSCADAVFSTLARDRLMKSGFKKVAVLREP